MEWNGKGKEMKWTNEKNYVKYFWKWNGMEMEWRWKYNGKKYDKSRGKINRWNGMEMERK